jgi:hypothetical protein
MLKAMRTSSRSGPLNISLFMSSFMDIPSLSQYDYKSVAVEKTIFWNPILSW